MPVGFGVVGIEVEHALSPPVTRPSGRAARQLPDHRQLSGWNLPPLVIRAWAHCHKLTFGVTRCILTDESLRRFQDVGRRTSNGARLLLDTASVSRRNAEREGHFSQRIANLLCSTPIQEFYSCYCLNDCSGANSDHSRCNRRDR